MFSDDRLVLQLISLLKQFGVRRIVISPGSRHFPITHSLERDPFFELFSVVDERSAAFFALGLIQKHNEPAAVCCTSGTSSLNYGSAVAEAFYQHLPLLLLTADRLPELLNQHEDQMLKQDDVFHAFIQYHGQLKQIHNAFDEWFCNRIINEALLSLSRHGPGPVQLNIPIESHDKDEFQTKEIPQVRKITRFHADEDRYWGDISAHLSTSKIVIVLGQTTAMSAALKESLDLFLARYNCVVLCDRLSNYTHEASFDNTFTMLRAFGYAEMEKLAPDIVISLFANNVFNGEIKAFVRPLGTKVQHWAVGRRSDVSDPYRRLTHLFDMNEEFFFRRAAEAGRAERKDYVRAWQEIAVTIAEPNAPYSEVSAIGELIRKLPDNASLHIANSAPIRMAFAYKIPPSVHVCCNRGINGIDGCMSSAVGYAANSNGPVFLIIGDLTFFYDMNSLWNRHLSPNLKIMLLNNEGGAVMHMPFKDDSTLNLPRHVSAGHSTSARGWVESLGIRYFDAHDDASCVAGVEGLVAHREGPALLEVFTKKEDDVRIFKGYLAGLKRQESTKDKIFRKAERTFRKFVDSAL